MFGRLPSASPDVEDLKTRLNDLLAKEKEHSVELRRTIDEKDSLYERLEQAMGRYMTAERKLDRAKSTQVLKLERQAIMGGNGDGASLAASRAAGTPKREHGDTNGELENGIASAEAEAQRNEALAAAKKQKVQLEEIEAENERLTNELSAARTKLASLSEDDFAETALFKNLKSQYEDVVRRVNDLEATNVQLREEAQKLHSERTSHRNQLDEEYRNQTADVEAANARAETDLARIRHTRDQLSSELAILKAFEEGPRTSVAQAHELGEARDLRISALESQVQRLELQLGQMEPAASDLENMDMDTLRAKFLTLENQYSLLSNELPSMEAAWKKSQALASKKIEDLAGLEDQVTRAGAEKAKADQKYFAAMKAKDMREAELRTLKSQNARSSEIVTQLKDGEAKTKELCANYERQLADTKEALTKLEQQHRTVAQKFKEASTEADALRKNVEELKALVSAKDKEILGTAKGKRQAEEDLEKCKARFEDSKKQYEMLRKSRAAVSATDSDDWRVSAGCGSGQTTTQTNVKAESRHLPRVQRQHPKHRPQALRARLLQFLCQGPNLEPIEKVP
jgi:E3 ubiquitin-protein ligase BRE1